MKIGHDPMIGEIIAIGDELTSGKILNTNSRFAAGHLFTAGHEIVAMATIGDTAAEIGNALKRAIKRADFVITIGGLGPTTDDRTNEAVADALDRPATFYPEILEKIQSKLSENPAQSELHLEKLAWLPKGAEVLKPESRMAGYLLIHDEKPIFFLPGVPHQMKELLADRVIPHLAVWQGTSGRHVRQRIFKIFGLPETEINKKLRHLENGDPQLRIGYYPVFPDVHVSLTVIDKNTQVAIDTFAAVSSEIETILDDYIYGSDNDSMAQVVGQLLRNHKKTLAVAESCTGGLISHKITGVAGCSDYFMGGVVAYSNSLKKKYLDVPGNLLQKFGAVSAQVALAMAKGIRTKTGSDFGIATTGIAGPTGGSREKPVGTVYFGICTAAAEQTKKISFTGGRRHIQELSAQTALDLLRRSLLDKKTKGM
jgi:nicotinamide-nucleotide amidase